MIIPGCEVAATESCSRCPFSFSLAGTCLPSTLAVGHAGEVVPLFDTLGSLPLELPLHDPPLRSPAVALSENGQRGVARLRLV